MARRKLEEINAGSMADIAFLLLIFFLVTTTMESNYGIRRKLPPITPPDNTDQPVIKKRNVLEININGRDQMLIEGNLAKDSEVKDITEKFITNNGKDPKSSDNPQKAVIQIKHTRETTYKKYISVYNELLAAYNELRDKYAKKKFGKAFDDLNEKQQKEVKDYYPQKIAESVPK